MTRPLLFILLTLIVVPAATHPTQATTIIVARTANEIVIGADSKVTDTFGNDLNKRACKIRQVGSLFIAFEGLEVDRKTGFSLPDISTSALKSRPTASATEKVSILSGFLISKLLVELPYLKTHDPETYARKIAGGQMFLRIVVAGFEKGQPLGFVRNFRAVEISAQQIGVTITSDDCLEDCSRGIVTRFLGETEAIEGLAEESTNFWRQGLSEGVRKLIETEIAARSEYVGPPIDILRIGRNGAQWIQNKPECAAIENPIRHSRR